MACTSFLKGQRTKKATDTKDSAQGPEYNARRLRGQLSLLTATHYLLSRGHLVLSWLVCQHLSKQPKVARSWGGSSALRHKCGPGLERDGFSRGASKWSQRARPRVSGMRGLLQRASAPGALKKGWGCFGGMNVCHALHMTFGLSHVVQRQLACGREGHSGHSWVACGATFIAMIGHNFS